MRRWVIFGALALAGCGPRLPGAVANQTYFWKVVSSEVTFGTCSDEAQFRKDLVPLKFEANSYLTYKVEPNAKTAVMQTCDRLTPSSCRPSAPKVVFTVADPELIFTSGTKSALGPGGCQLLDTTTWLLTDKGATGTLEITHVLSLVDNPPECLAAEAQLKQQAPNKLGLEGCVIVFKVGLTLS